MAIGTVKFFRADKGWGAISSPDVPDGADTWVHFSVIDMDGFRELAAGDRVEFSYEQVQQDSFRFRATRVRKLPRERRQTG
ncbi:cold-shock protein [Jiangella anatolica]|uniref:DNA-binding protein n=1 Tax=Jiangella anatolica TaxID=2670374 RepID=A0A2W2CEJ2_9ACTN|nr:cold shock domain-containing protein [Jiangella anatolica]PZF86717.1 DNA-binding protein [Jiangella anatolica]